MNDILLYQSVTVVPGTVIMSLGVAENTVSVRLAVPVVDPVDVTVDGEAGSIVDILGSDVLLVRIPPKVVVSSQTKVVVYCRSPLSEASSEHPTLTRVTLGDTVRTASDVEDAVQRAMRFLHRSSGGDLLSLRRSGVTVQSAQAKISIALSRLTRAASSIKATGARVESAKLLAVRQVTAAEAKDRYGAAADEMSSRTKIVVYISMKVTGTGSPVVSMAVM